MRSPFFVTVAVLLGRGLSFTQGSQCEVSLAQLRELEQENEILRAELRRVSEGREAERASLHGETGEPERKLSTSDDYSGLSALYSSMGGVEWWTNTGWFANTDPCSTISWYGVRCDSGAVDSISLSKNGLSGSIPSEIGN